MAQARRCATWRKSRDLRTAFGSCSTACIQGCWHGVVEASMMGARAQRIAPKQALAFCDALGKGTLERRQCLHGVGHGIMHQQRDDLHCNGVRQYLLGKCVHAVGGAAMFATAQDEGRSKAICAELPSGQRRQCIRGVQHQVDVMRVHGGSHQH